jgi:hypothetical protein
VALVVGLAELLGKRQKTGRGGDPEIASGAARGPTYIDQQRRQEETEEEQRGGRGRPACDY